MIPIQSATIAIRLVTLHANAVIADARALHHVVAMTHVTGRPENAAMTIESTEDRQIAVRTIVMKEEIISHVRGDLDLVTDLSDATAPVGTIELIVAEALKRNVAVMKISKRGRSLHTAEETTVIQVINSDKIKPSLNPSELPPNFICRLIFFIGSPRRDNPEPKNYFNKDVARHDEREQENASEDV